MPYPASAFAMKPMPTIFSVGRGRCVVIAADGCEDCVSAFSDFVNREMTDDDRVIVVLIQLPQTWLQSMYGKDGLSGLAERQRRELESRSQIAQRVAELVHSTPPTKVLNISTPGTGTAVIDEMTAPFVLQRLKWDDSAKADLTKFVDIAINKKVRFEAVLLKANNPNEAIVKYCGSVAADLLILGKHTNRILNWVKDVQTISYCQKHAPCPVKILGDSVAEADTSSSKSSEGDDDSSH